MMSPDTEQSLVVGGLTWWSKFLIPWQEASPNDRDGDVAVNKTIAGTPPVVQSRQGLCRSPSHLTVEGV